MISKSINCAPTMYSQEFRQKLRRQKEATQRFRELLSIVEYDSKALKGVDIRDFIIYCGKDEVRKMLHKHLARFGSKLKYLSPGAKNAFLTPEMLRDAILSDVAAVCYVEWSKSLELINIHDMMKISPHAAVKLIEHLSTIGYEELDFTPEEFTRIAEIQPDFVARFLLPRRRYYSNETPQQTAKQRELLTIDTAAASMRSCKLHPTDAKNIMLCFVYHDRFRITKRALTKYGTFCLQNIPREYAPISLISVLPLDLTCLISLSIYEAEHLKYMYIICLRYHEQFGMEKSALEIDAFILS